MNTCPSSPVPATLWDAFTAVPDRRSPQGRRYPLPALLMIAVAAMLCGRKTQAGIARWAKGLRPEELACLGIRQRRTPCSATWCLFFQSLEASELELCLGRWVTGSKRSYIGHVAIDASVFEAAGGGMVARHIFCPPFPKPCRALSARSGCRQPAPSWPACWSC